MNFKELMIKQMIKRGMFPNQAKEVMDKFIEDNENEFMEGRWFDNIAHYPENMGAMVWISVKEYTYQWIEKNAPQAWFKPMFQYTDAELMEQIKKKKA